MTQQGRREETAEMLEKIGRAFHIAGSVQSFEEIKMGHINRTVRADFVTETGDGRETASYLFQCVNTYVFGNPEVLMQNIEIVTDHLRKKTPEKPVLQFLYAGDGPERKNYLLTEDGFWRVCPYIPSVTFQKAADPSVIRKAGQAFGAFSGALSDLDPNLLQETIPQFHDTRRRFRDLRDAVEKDAKGRREAVGEELAWFLSVEDRACIPTDYLHEGKLPLRVTHNDTKINNVLFDPDTLEPAAIVDLDTVMPGLIGSDFGEAIRTAANVTDEDSTDLDRTSVDMVCFHAFAEGFLSGTAPMLTQTEAELLADTCFSMAVENGIRFLEDYLRGDVYFRTEHTLHNLERARCQMTLAKDMLRRMDEMRGAVLEMYGRYRGR